jgi:hypothetical protein
VSRRVRDRDPAALRDPEERKPREPEPIHDGLEIADARVQGEVVDVPVRQTVPASGWTC